MQFATLSSAVAITIASLSLAGSTYAKTPLQDLVSRAASSNANESASAIAALRSQGPNGLQAFLSTHSQALTLGATLPEPGLRKTLDSLCQQRDCYASRLFWYTDFEQAKAAAKASGKPILSLRLLGQLDQELSCANSRFFRVALYPNAQVSQLLRDRFILHWQSVRPVPKVTIDFGDGRKLERTLTGNSIHYVLDAEGRPIEAIPGLYGPQAFLRQLQQAEQAVKQYTQRPVSERAEFLRQYHRDRLAEVESTWRADLQKLGITALPAIAELPNPNQPPTAAEAGQIAMTKMVVENPIISAISFTSASNRKLLETATNQAAWARIAALHDQDARLDRNSVALIQSKNQSANSSKTTATPLQVMLQKFEASIAMDTVRNEYLLHSELHQWFVQGLVTRNIETLNESVYAQLFLTPSSDPWLGLGSDDNYTAIENDGVSQ